MRFLSPTSNRRIPACGGSNSARSKSLLSRQIKRLLFFQLSALTLFFLPPGVAAQETTRRVLVLSGSDPNFPGFSVNTRNIQQTLRERSPVRVEFLYELQRTLAVPSESPADDEELAKYLKQKYADKHIDLVLVLVAARFRVLLQKEPGLFADVPKIFYEYDAEREEINRALGPNITGVWAPLDLNKTLELALALQPDTQKVVVVSGTGPEDKIVRDRAQLEFRKYENRVEFSYPQANSIEEVRSQLAALPSKSFVIFLSFTTDKAGNRYSGPEAFSTLVPYANAPMYGYSDSLMGLGITGGNLLDFEALGKQIGGMSLRVLAGEKPGEIPQEAALRVMTVDWRQVQRWGLTQQALPPGTVIRFKQPSFWEQYKWHVIGLIAAVIIEAMLIAWLLFLRIGRRQAEKEGKRLALVVDEQHRHLNEVVSNIPGVVWEVLIDSATGARKATFCSDYIETMLGYTAGVFLSNWELAFELIHEADRERVAREYQAVLAGATRSVEFRCIAKDGHTVWAEVHMTPIFDEEGAIAGVRGVTLDATQQNLAEHARRQSEETNRAIFQAIPDQMLLQTRDGLFLDHRGDPLVPSERLLGKNIRDVFPPELAGNFLQRFQRATKDDTQVFEYQLPFNGSGRWFEARIVQSGEDILTVVRDVTSRKTAEEALRQSEARFREMADTAPVMVWVSDADQLRTYFNQNWLKFSGRSLEQELGTGWAEGIHEDDYCRCLDLYQSAFDRRQSFAVEYRRRRVDGKYRWVLDHGAPRFSSDGEFLGFIGSCIDITERKQAEETLRSALEEVAKLKNQLEVENIYLQETLRLEQTSGEIVGQSDAIKYVLFKISQVAPTDSTVMIMGDTGTGKELVAHAIHEGSTRKDHALIKVNCAALSENLIESELFGHEKGAFTGATARKLGRFELANCGTIFLDEIGELPLRLQAKLLRVIQEGEFERLGGTKTIKVDVRIIAATNRDLKVEVEKGTFRQDLWYRLNVLPVTTPPLNQRKEDIPLLVEHFVARCSKKFGKSITSVSASAMRTLQEHSWPGNVRELANVIERAVIYTQGSVLKVVDRFEPVSEELPSEARSLEEMERDYIIHTLEITGWRIEGVHGAAKILGVNPSTLRARMNKLQIQRPHQLSHSTKMPA
jgi:PAS domain S-box-containing protein